MEILDTIAAISTPYGKGGVAVLRVSGAQAVNIASRVFRPKNGRTLDAALARMATYGTILAPEADGSWQEIDDGIATVFRAPASFTGEDVVEICCHGGILITRTVLSALLSAGARPATAGEFTRRAHLNGKLGLHAAQSLGALLEAQNAEQIKLARGGMGGAMERSIHARYEQLRHIMSAIFACIDFPDEDLSDMSREQMQRELGALIDDLRALAATYRTGHAIAEGIPTVLCGHTNVGKSSLYNRIVGHDAAIVTDTAGTTRDVLCESAALGRVTLRVFDTAGLRDTDDPIEQIGITRARDAMADAELILSLFDLSRPLGDGEQALLQELQALLPQTTCIGVLNKSDLAAPDTAKAVTSAVCAALPHTVTLSATTGEGFSDLIELVEQLFVDGTIDTRHDAVVVNARQHASLLSAIEALTQANESLACGVPLDLCCADVERAMTALSCLDGRAVDEDIVNEIFSHFCVGK